MSDVRGQTRVGRSAWIRAVLIFLASAFAAQCAPVDSADALDLAGPWRLTALRSADERRDGTSTNNHLDKVYTLPENFHVYVQDFAGELQFEREFELRSVPERPAVLIGAAGTADVLRLNGTVVGRTGTVWNGDVSISYWNSPRLYAVPRDALRIGRNTIHISLTSLDEKAGVHRGPLLLGDYADLSREYNRQRLLYEFLPAGATIFLAYVLIFFLATQLLGILRYEYFYVALAVAAFLIFCGQYVPLYLPFSRLSVLRLTLAAGYLAAILNLLFFYRLFVGRNARVELLLLGPGMIPAVLHFVVADFAALWTLARYVHVFVFAVVFVVVLIFADLYRRRPEYRRILHFMLPAAVLSAAGNFWDYLIRLHVVEGTQMFLYAAPLYVVGVLVLHSHMMKTSIARAQAYRHRLTEERERIAGDIHDSIGSDLTALLFYLESNHRGDGEQETAQVFKPVVDRLRDILDRMRDLVYLLKLEESPAGMLEQEMINHLNWLKRAGRIDIRHDLESGLGQRLGWRKSLHTLRIFQEWITNVLRHARPNEIHVKWARRRNACVLVIRDDGPGFSFRAADRTTGSGLASIKRRSANIKARLRSTKIRGGSVFVLRIPLLESERTGAGSRTPVVSS